jgi:hypothetical protein
MYKKITSIKYCTLFIIIFSLASCKENVKEGMKEINITILFPEKIKNSNNELPSGIKKLLYPIEPQNCKETAFIPKITLTRIDFKKPKSVPLEIPLSSVSKMKKKVGTFTFNNLMTDYKEEIPKLKLDKLLTLNSEKEIELSNMALNKYSIDFIYASDSAIVKNERVFYTSESIRKHIKEGLCNSENTDFTILYYPNRREKISSIKSITKIIKTQNNEISEKIQQENDSNHKKVERKVNNFISKYKPIVTEQEKDYRPIYELMKTFIFGVHRHNEAYEMLKIASRVAILNGKSNELLLLINQDIENDKKIANKSLRTVWKLSVGHFDDWCPIIKGLSENSIELLEKPCQSKHKKKHKDH